MSNFDLKNMSNSNTQVDCWLEEEVIDVSIKINKQKFHCFINREEFYNDLISRLEIMNVSSFIVVVYSEGEVNTWSTTVDDLKLKLKLWKEGIPKLENIDEILKLN